jgi:alpha-mannosidase
MGFVSAIKASEDGTGYVVRVVELTNRRGYGTLLVPRQIHRVIRTNALEGLDPEDVPVELSIVDQRVTVPLRPLEVVTLVALP